MASLRRWVVCGWFLGVVASGLSLAALSGCGDSQPETGAQAKADKVEEKKAEDGMKEFMARKAAEKKK
jgi:hypothetical protein